MTRHRINVIRCFVLGPLMVITIVCIVTGILEVFTSNGSNKTLLTLGYGVILAIAILISFENFFAD